MSGTIDLHIHTTASDGTLTPSEAVSRARELGLSAIAITDHDTHRGVKEAIIAGQEAGVEVVPGIEISVDYENKGVHILGYFIDPNAPALEELLAWVEAERRSRNAVIAQAMRQEGLPVTLEDMERKYPGAVLGRPHFAAELVDLGLAADVNDAFQRYMNRGMIFYRKRTYIPIPLAFEAIRSAGGKAVIAHPFQYRKELPELREMIGILKDAGAVGMECLYGTYAPEQHAQLLELAKEFSLLPSGGSDYHGSRKPNQMGSPAVPYACLEALRNL